MEDFKKIIYAVLAGFAVLMVVWLGFLFFSACGFDFACRRAAAGKVESAGAEEKESQPDHH
ncbi:MAG: hypothetical protein HND45_09750, partial [Chloroflexi bacterium]|nr:hypothetical protein [Chloroflexota bacterium]NOG76165.1 hypothetical protein [Chloroflexota bacterium]